MGAIGNYFFPINPVTERREFHLIPTSIERSVGASSYAPLIEKSGGEIKQDHADPKYREYYTLVQDVGAELARQAKRKDLEFEFKLIDSDKDNAWCLPGGKIGINVGLIQRMESENKLGMSNVFTLREKIAAVLSHEVVHADARHTGRSLEFRLFLIGILKAAQVFVVYHWVIRSYNAKIDEARQDKNNPLILQLTQERDQKTKATGALFDALSSGLISGISLCNSRSHELESDRFGMRMIRDIAKTSMEYDGDSPQAAIWLQHYFVKHHSHETHNHFLNRVMNFFSSHPTPEERRQANQETWGDLQAGRL